MEELKEKVIDSILNMFSSGKSNLRCFLTLFIVGIFILLLTVSMQDIVVSIFNLSSHWSEEYILGFNKIYIALFSINIIYWIFAIIYFIKYSNTEEVWID